MSDLNWWAGLEEQWKEAFGITFFHHPNQPTVLELEQLFASTVLRFAGPRAPYPNMQYELTNLSGLSGLQNLEILVVSHHQIKELSVLQPMVKLKSLFLFNNEIESLAGIEALFKLEQLYVQYNKIDSIQPLAALTGLKEVYVNNNIISSLEGLTEEHSDQLTSFYCQPNENLKQKEIIRVENQLGIRCKGA